MKRRHRIAIAIAALVTSLAGCSVAVDPTPTSPSTSITSAALATSEGDVFDASQVHTISLEVDPDVLTGMIETYLDTGDKEWVKGTVTIDGETFTDVGIKLKGNSSLRSITTDTPVQDLPLRIRLDKYVDDQNVDGFTDFAVRSNTSATAINEAVSLDLLTDAGLASEGAIATRFSINGSDEALRLTVQNLDDTWLEQNFPDAGDSSVLYKSQADGDWSWRGEDGDYTASFEIEAGDDNYAPLIELLDLLNNGPSDRIAEELPTMLDVDSFAQYLALEEVIDNFDDISGPGNNSYLMWDSATQQFTLVAWDHNLAFGAAPMGGGEQGGSRPAGQPQAGDARPSGAPSAPGPITGGPDQAGGGGGGQGGPAGKENPLVDAFNANAEWEALYETKLAALAAEFGDGGGIQESVEQWESVITQGAADLVSTETIDAETDAILAYPK